jgi:O-antigen/teichoic acid export membrane protein
MSDVEQAGAALARRGFATSVALYGIATLASSAAAFLVFPFYTRFLGPAGYGLVETVSAGLSLAAAVLLLGMDSAIAILIHERRAAMRPARIVSTAFALAFAAGVVGLIVAALLAVPTAAALLGDESRWPLVVVAGLAVVPSVVYASAQASLRNLERARAYVRASLAFAITLGVVGVGSVVLLDSGPVGAILAAAAATTAACLVALRELRGDIGRASLSVAVARSLLAIGLPLVPASIAVWAVGWLDRLLLAWMAGLEEVGLYGAAAKVALGLGLLATVFLLAWSPFALKVQRELYARRLYGDMLTVVAALGAAATIAAALVAEPILALIAGRQFVSAAPVVWMLVGSTVLNTIYAMLVIGLQLGRRTSLISLTTGIAAVADVVVNLALIPMYGFLGAGVATMIAYGASVIGVYLAAQRTTRIPYEPAVLLAIGTLAVASATAVQWLGALGSWPAILLAVAGIATVLILSLPAARRLAELRHTTAPHA